jgi:hypothetical protein
MIRLALIALALTLSLAACPGGSTPADCPAPACALTCDDGLRRDADGCEICECNPTPDTACATDGDCVLAIRHADCCQCRAAYNAASIAGHACLRPIDEAEPPGCARGESCEGTACRCEFPIRAACEGGTCTARSDCPAGEVMELDACAPACAGHADCVLAADYGSCCGGCQALSLATVEAHACYAERAEESGCSPPFGACDGLGCPSPPLDCVASGSAAVCMADGTCQNAGPDGDCPVGSMDVGDVCVPTP